MKRFLTSCCALLSGLAVVLTLGACDSITELNDNPNAPGEAQLSFLMTNAQTRIADEAYGSFTLGRFANYYAQYWAPTTYVNEARYEFPDVRSSSNQAIWDNYYDILNDLQEVKQIAANQPTRASVFGDPADIQAMAMVQQAWVWQTLTDIYGAIPLDSALAGRDNFQPSYASQETVYGAIVDSLNTAQGMFTGETAFGSADVVFDGDTEHWQAFANALIMRYAIRAAGGANSSYDPAEEWFTRAYENTSFTDMSGFQNATIPFGESSPYQNPLYVNTVVTGRTDWATSRTLTNQMNEINDPRRPAYAQGSDDGVFRGLPYGLTSGELSSVVNNFFSLPSERVAYTATSPAIIFQEAEELFMIAEAAERGWINADPADNYEEAIRASLAYWDAGDQADSFISRVPYDNSNEWAPAAEGGTPTWVQTLGTQKWLALYMQGVQGWAEFRRLDFDNVLYLPPPSSQGAPLPGVANFGEPFPARLPYPDDEPALNTQSYQNAVSEFLDGPDDQGTFLWWDDNDFGEPAGIAGQDD